jgi:hypothetical protein
LSTIRRYLELSWLLLPDAISSRYAEWVIQMLVPEKTLRKVIMKAVFEKELPARFFQLR